MIKGAALHDRCARGDCTADRRYRIGRVVAPLNGSVLRAHFGLESAVRRHVPMAGKCIGRRPVTRSEPLAAMLESTLRVTSSAATAHHEHGNWVGEPVCGRITADISGKEIAP